MAISPYPKVRISLKDLEKDYEQMGAMFYQTKRPEWALILKTIEEFEREFNTLEGDNS